MVTQPQPKNSHTRFPSITRVGQLNRRTIIGLLAVALAVLVISSLLPNSASAVDSIGAEKSGVLSNISSVSGTSSEIPGLENPNRNASASQNDFAPTSSVIISSLLLPPLQSGGKQVLVSFDDVPSGTNVGNRYSDVKFSSSNRTIEARSTWGPPSSPPNTASPCCDNLAGFGDFVATFPQPVKDLTFNVNVCDQIGISAQVDLYQDNSATPTLANQKVPCNGSGLFSIPVVSYVGLSNINKVVVHNVTDPLGLAYDNFSFTVQAATPTPTPTPAPIATPPPAPTNLKATPDEEAIDLQWTASPDATGYVIKRTNQPANGAFVRSPNLETASAIGNSDTDFKVLAEITTNTTSFRDANLSSDVRYDYVVVAVGSGGRSADSNPVFAIPLPKNGCSLPTLRPLNGGQQDFVSGAGWSMNYNISENDGLVLRDVALNGRRMAARISVPYFRLETQTAGQSPVLKRGQLMPDGVSDGLRSRIVEQKVVAPQPPDTILSLHVVYAIDQMPGTPKACLLISEDFQFFKPGTMMLNPPYQSGPCEPSGRVQDCAKFRPMIHYQFTPGNQNEFLKRLDIPQRQHYEVGKFGTTTAAPRNTVGLFQDADGEGNAFVKMGFEIRVNPVTLETWGRGIRNGRKPTNIGGLCPEDGPFDNMHQTYNTGVSTPPISASVSDLSLLGFGCPECVHMHWRWGDFQPPPFGQGKPLLYPPDGSNEQASLDVSVVKQVNGEEDPIDYFQTFKCPGFEPIGPNDAPVFWYAASSSRSEDYMFWHTAWFKAGDPSKSNLKSSLLQSEASAPLVATQDGPLSINLGDVFESGENNVEAINITTLPPLPSGYVALNNVAYRITTHAEAAGPATIDFGAVSVTDESGFNNVRIFHAEADPFDPEKAVWVDRTVLAPNSPAPNFSTRILTSITDHLGDFVIGKLVQVVPPSSDRVNLSVTSVDGPDPVMAGQPLTYTITITNTGPQVAHNVALRDDLSAKVFYDSATATQGSCKALRGKAYCDLNTLNVGASATVILKVLPRHGYTVNYDVENSVTIRAAEQDDDASNNTSVIPTTVFPDPNNPPTVALMTTSPAIVSGPATVQLTATATDSDGTIAKIEFFDNRAFIGTGVAIGGGAYTFNATVQPCNSEEDHHSQQHDHNQLPCGAHALVAIATDNGGRSSVSTSAVVFVNGSANVSITSPASGSLLSPGGDLTLTATATNSTGSISEVEFFANDVSLGHAASTGQNQYSLLWTSVPAGNFKIVAVARDANNVPSRSVPAMITVGTAPLVSLLTPLEGARFAPASNVSLSASATSTNNSVQKVEFFANGVLIGSDSGIANGRFFMTWRQPSDGMYTITAVATDAVGLKATSLPVNIGINTSSAQTGVTVWFDDAVPVGATTQGSGDVNTNGEWYWVDANPGAFSGTLSHQSRNFKEATAPAIHSHYFQNATAKLHVDANDKLFTYVFLDVNNMPREIMLEWKDAGGSEHRAYWGANNINFGVDGTVSRHFMGRLPAAGEWVRLEVPASWVGFSNNDLDGMKFILDGGRATWDVTGKTAVNYNPPPTTPNIDTNWVNGSLPPGAVADFPSDWQWIACGVAVACHQSVLEGQQLHDQHRFKGATPQPVNSGDQLFTYVAIDPANPPNQLFLQWHDGSTWHGAYWGRNFRAVGVTGTESWRYMGGLPTPPASVYVRLEIPASYVGLEGKSVSGMAFGFFKETGNALITWGRSGKTKAIGPTPSVLSAITPVYQFFNKDLGYYFETKEVHLHSSDQENGAAFFAYPNKAAGTVPMYRYANTTKREFFYSTCGTDCNFVSVWQRDGIAFYVYKSDDPRPGTVPLHMYHDNVKFQYFLSTTPPPISGKTEDGIWGYVYDLSNKLVPVRPSFLTWQASTCQLSWLDNSLDETGFRIESSTSLNPSWTTVTTVGPGVTSKADCNLISGSWGTTNYRVFAVNNIGDSFSSNELYLTRVKKCRGCVWSEADTATGDPPAESDNPNVNISNPLDGAIVGKNLVVSANVFDIDGNGSIAKVEFFDGLKLGELTGPPPYNFIWNNIANGPHTLTVKVTDGSGMTTTSAAVHITVSAEPSVALTNPASDTVIPAPGNITLQATASDADGSVAKVEFFSGNVKLGEDTTSPYSFAWNSIQPGTYVVTAKVTDNVGLTTTSGPTTVKVNSAPTVTLTGPANGEVVPAPGAVLLGADVVDMDGTINKVDFYQGATLLGTSTTFPYFYNWTNAPYGNYSITAKATDNNGAETVSAPVNWIVNSAPNVSITSPVNSAMFTPSSNVSINASASDPDGTISKVDFYQGTNLIGTDSTSPFSISWNNVALGSSVLTAQATDNRGAVTTSAAVTVTTSTFFDDFNDNSLNSTKWAIRDPLSPAVISEQSQQLRITLPANTATYNGVGSNATYDMRGGIAQVEVVQTASQAGWVESSFSLELDAQNYLLIATGAGSIVFRAYLNGVNDQQVASYNPAAQRYWRFRHTLSTNSVSFETSPDGAVWTSQRTVTAGSILASARFALFAGAWGPYNASPGAAIYDNFQYIASDSGLIAHWRFDENTGTTTADSSGNGNTGTLANGPGWTAGQTNAALSFDGVNDQVLNNGADLINNFTISFWAQPTSTHEIDGESTVGWSGVSGQRYMLWPLWNDNGHAGFGVSVGTNGVSVYEHAANYMPATLVYSGSLSGWTKVTIVYENKQPKLYINGTLVRTGLTSPMSFVHLNPAEIGGDVYGYYAGKLDEIRVYNRPLSAAEVATLP